MFPGFRPNGLHRWAVTLRPVGAFGRGGRTMPHSIHTSAVNVQCVASIDIHKLTHKYGTLGDAQYLAVKRAIAELLSL